MHSSQGLVLCSGTAMGIGTGMSIMDTHVKNVRCKQNARCRYRHCQCSMPEHDADPKRQADGRTHHFSRPQCEGPLTSCVSHQRAAAAKRHTSGRLLT